MQIVGVTKDDECCCSCAHNIRTDTGEHIACHCDIDHHYIGYVANFESVCEEWEMSGKTSEVQDGKGKER